MSATTAIAGRARAPWLRLPRPGTPRELDLRLAADAGVRIVRGGTGDCLAARRRIVAHVFQRINGRRQE
ncbi:MAG TPA: hypothetical protein VKX45_02805 [Bryobacteraceae bacterium]|jgi:hypothetical protein|nr:hypothetical protein [Bryobacteraceae bacterium]